MHPNHWSSLLTHKLLGSIPTVSDWAGLQKGLRFGISKFPSDVDAVGPRTSWQASTSYGCLSTLPTLFSLLLLLLVCSTTRAWLTHSDIFPSYHGEKANKTTQPTALIQPMIPIMLSGVWPWILTGRNLSIMVALIDWQAGPEHQRSQGRSHTLSRR